MDVEQTEQTQEATESTETEASATEAAAPATRDDLIAAARAAAASEGKPAEASAETQKPSEPTEEEPGWKRLIREREKAQAEREATRNETEALRQKAQEEAKAIVEEAKRQAQAEIAAERERWKTRFQTDPEGALGELGDGEQVAGKILDLNTPHGKAIAQLRQELAKTQKEAAEGKTVRDEFETFKRSQVEQAERARYEAARQQFFSDHATSEKTPSLHTLYEPEEIEERANKVAREWADANLRFDLKDVAQYLEAKASERLAARGLQPARQSGAGAPAKEPGVAPKSAANGSRTITAASGSERRASPKPFHELSPAEQREDLIRVAREAFRQHGKT